MNDPVAARRARLQRAVRVAKRLGYGALLVGIVAFAAGVALDFPTWAVSVAITGVVASCVILPLPIILGYGIRAAERADRADRERRVQSPRPHHNGGDAV